MNEFQNRFKGSFDLHRSVLARARHTLSDAPLSQVFWVALLGAGFFLLGLGV